MTRSMARLVNRESQERLLADAEIRLRDEQRQSIQRIDNKIDRLEDKVDRLDDKVDRLETKFENRFIRLEDKMDNLESKFEDKFTRLEDKFDDARKQNTTILISVILGALGIITTIILGFAGVLPF